jgi:hypothetical protein
MDDKLIPAAMGSTIVSQVGLKYPDDSIDWAEAGSNTPNVRARWSDQTTIYLMPSHNDHHSSQALGINTAGKKYAEYLEKLGSDSGEGLVRVSRQIVVTATEIQLPEKV